jgi:ubiquinone/menaquinone biosynthesis C-methylase UbiE
MVHKPPTNSISVYEQDFQLKVSGQKGILHPSEDLIRLVMRGKISASEPKAIALDFGVGDGRHIEYLMSLGYDVVGTDVAPSSIAVTKKLFLGSQRYRGVLLENCPLLPLPDNTVSLVVAWEVLHWLGSPETFEQAMREFLRVLVRSGTILLTMPTETHYLKRYSLETAKSTYLSKTKTRMNCVFYSPNLFTLRHLFEEELGLKIQQMLRYEYGSTATEMTLDERMSFYGICLTRAS